jgi:hypothetical protein
VTIRGGNVINLLKFKNQIEQWVTRPVVSQFASSPFESLKALMTFSDVARCRRVALALLGHVPQIGFGKGTA